MIGAALRNLDRPRSCSASAAVAMPWMRPGPQRCMAHRIAHATARSAATSARAVTVHRTAGDAPAAAPVSPAVESPPRTAGREVNSSSRGVVCQCPVVSPLARVRAAVGDEDQDEEDGHDRAEG